MTSHIDVITNFANRKINKRVGEVSWHGHSVYCTNNVLYSYGSHFPLAKYIGRSGDHEVFVKNIDKYSNTTSHHQSMTNQHCKGPLLSRNQLATLGIDFLKLEMKNIIHNRAAYRNHVFKDNQTGKYYNEAHMQRYGGNDHVDVKNSWFAGGLEDKLISDEWTPPEIGYFDPHYKRRVERIVGGTWVVDNATVIYFDRKYYLVYKNKKSKTEIQKLSRKPKDIAEAFDMVKV